MSNEKEFFRVWIYSSFTISICRDSQIESGEVESWRVSQAKDHQFEQSASNSLLEGSQGRAIPFLGASKISTFNFTTHDLISISVSDCCARTILLIHCPWEATPVTAELSVLWTSMIAVVKPRYSPNEIHEITHFYRDT